MDPTWPSKDVLRRRVQQLMMKQRLSNISHKYQHKYQHPNNILSGDQPLQVLNHQLEKGEINKIESPNWHPNTAKGFLVQVGTYTIFATNNTSMLSLQLLNLLNWVTTYWPTLRTREIPTHFHLQDQYWQLHYNINNSCGDQPHSTTSLPTIQPLPSPKNDKQLQYCLTQYITHILIVYLHWYFRPQGDILSTNLIQLIIPAIGIGGH